MSTGAYPGTHGITDFFVLDQGDPLDGGRDGFSSDQYRAETLWQAAARAGRRVATINFAGAERSQHPKHLWVAGRSSPSTYTPYATAPLLPALRDATPVELDGGEAIVHLTPDYVPGDGLRLRLHVDGDGVRVTEADGGRPLATLPPGKPGPWLWGRFATDAGVKEASYRLELTQFDPEGPALALYVSQITHPEDIADPPAMGRRQ